MDRFPILRGISALLKVLAVLVLVGGFFGGLAVRQELGGGSMLLTWVLAAGNGIGLWAFAKLIGVLLAIEENTRRTADSTVTASRPPSAGPLSGGGRSLGAGRPSGAARDKELERPAWMRS